MIRRWLLQLIFELVEIVVLRFDQIHAAVDHRVRARLAVFIRADAFSKRSRWAPNADRALLCAAALMTSFSGPHCRSLPGVIRSKLAPASSRLDPR